MRGGKVALKDLWEYKRWYPIVILQQVAREWGWSTTALISVNGWPETWEYPGKECQIKDGGRLCRHRPIIHTCESSKMNTKEECNIGPPNFWFWFHAAHGSKVKNLSAFKSDYVSDHTAFGHLSWAGKHAVKWLTVKWSSSFVSSSFFIFILIFMIYYMGLIGRLWQIHCIYL